MELSLYSDYALRILMVAGALPADGQARIEEVSRSLGLSRHHVRKIVHELGQAGFLTTAAGRKGGFRLARRPEKISIAAVLKFTERSFAPVECLREEGDCILHGTCRLEGILQKATRAFIQTLEQYTLASIINPGLKRRLAEIATPGFET